jgi:GNAT superfamily N-acetyltransferase
VSDSVVNIEAANSPLDARWISMTFPYYRHLLPLIGTGESTKGGQQPLACIASSDGTPVGLALAERAAVIPPTAEVLSLFVVEDFRGRGIATRLLACLEEVAVRRGVCELSGTYMSGRPSLEALERVLTKRGFEAPTLRMIAFKFTPDQAAQCRWYRQARVPAGASIFKWTELTDSEMTALRQSQAERQWIHPKLTPWYGSPHFDHLSSFGMRKDGEVVGWVINHRLSPGVVTFSIAFMRSDLARRGASFPLYVASLEALKGTGALCSFVTNAVDFPDMARFMLRHGTPFAEYAGETLGVRKALSGPRT